MLMIVSKAVSCDADDADVYNRSFCGLCSMHTVKIFFQLINNAYNSRQYFFGDYFYIVESYMTV